MIRVSVSYSCISRFSLLHDNGDRLLFVVYRLLQMASTVYAVKIAAATLIDMTDYESNGS